MDELKQGLLPLSGTWLILVSLGALGWVPHASVGLDLGGHGYALMFW